VCVNRSYQIAPPPVPPPPVSPPEKAELNRKSAARESAWEAYCKPTTYVGGDGLTHYRYAHANCDMVVLSRRTPRTPWAPED
jgi:hypothetical protein